MASLSPQPASYLPALPPFLLANEYPFAVWTDLGDRPDLHPVLRAMWNQVKRNFWMKGHPAAGALFEAIYTMSLRPSFRVGVGK